MDGLTAPALVWAWANYGRRWHLRADGAGLALCGVGKRGWELAGGAFDRADLYVLACLPCLRAERTTAPASAAGDGGA